MFSNDACWRLKTGGYHVAYFREIPNALQRVLHGRGHTPTKKTRCVRASPRHNTDPHQLTDNNVAHVDCVEGGRSSVIENLHAATAFVRKMPLATMRLLRLRPYVREHLRACQRTFPGSLNQTVLGNRLPLHRRQVGPLNITCQAGHQHQ